jgi:hypothetical protein
LFDQTLVGESYHSAVKECAVRNKVSARGLKARRTKSDRAFLSAVLAFEQAQNDQ